MTDKLKIGDRVKVLRRRPGTPESAVGKTFTIKQIGGHPEFGLNVPCAGGVGGLWWYDASGLELVQDHRKSARILTEKVLINDIPCRKILGFEGILGRDELPGKYLEGKPEFHLVPKGEACWNIRHFDGSHLALGGAASEVDCIGFGYEGSPRVDMYGLSDVLNVGDIVPDTTFQNILIWLKRAGSRLAKIRAREKAAWSGKETVEI